jgi:hypothetical protein
VVGPVELRAEPDLQGIDVILVVGRNWQGVVEAAADGGTTTTASTSEVPVTTTTTEAVPAEEAAASC